MLNRDFARLVAPHPGPFRERSRMRVCYVSTGVAAVDGWTRYTVEVALRARAHGIEPVLVTPGGPVDPGLADCERHTWLPALFAGRATTLRSLLLAGRLRSVLQTCDIVHCPVELYAPLVAFAAPPRLPFVLSAFGSWAIRPLESRLMRPIFGPAFRRADVVLCISRFTQGWLSRLIDLRRAEVLAGGVTPEPYQEPAPADLPGWAHTDPFVLSVGIVKPRKGQHIGLEAIALARRSVPNLHYVIAGTLTADPAYVARLRQRAEALGMAEYVHFLGQLPPYGELTAWFQQASAFMLLSTSVGSSFEGLGFVFLEAGAAGTPAIGTRRSGIEEAIVDGETGFLVAQDDPEAAANALTRLVTDHALRDRMGEAARVYARRLSWENLADRCVAIYRELAGQAPPEERETDHG